MDHGEDPHLSAAIGTLQDVHCEHPAEQIGPSVAAEWAAAAGGR